MNICGCLVHALPERAAAVRAAIAAADGVEVHAETEDGRIVIVVEDTARQRASETIMALHQVPGVVSIMLTYHHFEDPAARPRDLAPSTAGGLTHDPI